MTMTNLQASTEEKKLSQARNAIRVITLFTVASLSVLGFLAFQAVRTPSTPQLWTIVVITTFVIAFMFAGLVVARSGRHERGIWLAFLPWLLLLVVIVAFVSGLGFVFMAVSISIITLISGPTLPSRQATGLNVVGAVTAIIILLVDFFIPSERIVIPGFDAVAIVVVGALVLVFGYTTVRQFGNYSLRAKLLVAFIGVTVVATGALGAFMISSTTNNLQENLERELSEVATSRAVRVGDLFNEQINTLTTLSQNAALQGAVEAQSDFYVGSAAEIQATLDARDAQWRAADEADNNNDPLVRGNLTNTIARELTEYQQAFPDNVEVFITDVYGGLVGATNRTSDYYQADEGWWQAAYANGEGAVYIGDPEYDESAGVIGVNIALPIHDQYTGNITGILRTTYGLSALGSVLAENVGETGRIDLLIPGETVTHIHEGGMEETVPGLFEQLQKVSGQGMTEMVYEGTLSVVTQAPIQTLEGNPSVDNLGWVIAFFQHREEAYATLNEETQGLVIVMLIVVALAAAFAFALSLVLVRPIIRLTTTTEEVTAGNLDSRAEVTSADEVGALATAFNTMTSQLQETLQGLEERVASATRNLTLAAEVGSTVAQEHELGALLSGAAELIRERFELYYTQIYLLDPTGRSLILRAGTGEVGQQLLERGHSLAADLTSLNGTAAVERRAVIVENTETSTIHRPNPLLPDTRSEMVVPLLVGENVVGVLDMQSAQAGTLSAENLVAFEALAGQLAIAVENVTLLAETEEARAQVEAQSRRLIREGWDDFLNAVERGERIGYTFDQQNIATFTEPVSPETDEDTLVENIPVSNEPVGLFKFEGQESWSEDETELVANIAHQLGQQIENLRLLAQADQYRAEAENAVRRLTREGWESQFADQSEAEIGFTYNLNIISPLSEDESNGSQPAKTHPLETMGEKIGELSIAGTDASDVEIAEVLFTVSEQLTARIENLRLSEQMERSLARTDELYGISQSMNEAISEAEMLEALAKPAAKAGAIGANLMYLDMDSAGNPEWAEIVADWREEGEAPIPVGTRFFLPDLPFSKLWITDPDNPLLISNVQTDDRVDDATRAAMEQGFSRALTIVPLTRGQERVGLITFTWDQPHEYSQHEKETYSAIIGLASPAVHGRRLFEQAQKQADRETMLNVISQKIQSATSVDAVLQIAARELGHALDAPMTIAQLGLKDKDQE